MKLHEQFARMGMLECVGGEVDGTSPKAAFVVGPPVAPVALGKMKAHQTRALEAYYVAYAAWVAKQSHCVAVSETGSSGVSAVDEPASSVSAGSSASTGKARKRARRRARLARQKVDAAASAVSLRSEATYGGTVCAAEDAEEELGYCYLGVVKPEHAALARVSIGRDPTFEKILSSPEEWFHRLGQAGVVRVRPGLYHVADAGLVTVQECFASVVQSSGRIFEEGQLGDSVVMTGHLRDGLLARAPAMLDVCGALAPEDENGYCYLRMVRPDCVQEARAALKWWPSWHAILSSPGRWYGAFDGLHVQSTGDGRHHVGRGYASVDLTRFLSSMIHTHGQIFEVGQLGRSCSEGDPASCGWRVPRLDECCGGAVCVEERPGACFTCGVEEAYACGSSAWTCAVVDLSMREAHAVKGVVTPDGAVLCVFRAYGVAYVVPLSDERDLRDDSVGALFACRKHGVSLGQCGCRAILMMDGLCVHRIHEVDVPGVVCTGACREVSAKGMFEEVRLGFRVAVSTTKEWKPLHPERLNRLGAYRQLGGYPRVV